VFTATVRTSDVTYPSLTPPPAVARSQTPALAAAAVAVIAAPVVHIDEKNL
jgi:hypothetical protein